MSQLNLHSNILAFADPATVSSNPKLRHFDWTVDISQVPISGPENKEHILAPAETKTLFSGSRTLTTDVTTEFSVTLNAAKPGVYRLTTTGGTAPGFRASRAVAIGGESLVVAINNNATTTFALTPTSTPTFAAVQVGDVVFIPDVTTGDAQSPFNILNVGFWAVLAIGPSGAGANRKLTCRRLAGESFEGVAETVAVAASAEFAVFSSGPVQAGDSLVLAAGFSSPLLDTYVVQTVTDTWIEFVSGENLPLEVDILPGAAGIKIYNGAKCFVHVEVDQLAYLRLNEATGNEVQLKPRSPGDLAGRAHFEIFGTVWSLVVVNRSAVSSMTVQVISASEAT